MNDGTAAVLFQCYGDPGNHPDQYWTAQDVYYVSFNGLNYPFYAYHNLANYNKCLGVSGGSMSQGAAIVIWDCNGSMDQHWMWGVAGNTDTFANENPFWHNNGQYMVVGVKSAATGNGAPLVLWGYQAGHNDQLWAEKL